MTDDCDTVALVDPPIGAAQRAHDGTIHLAQRKKLVKRIDPSAETPRA